MAAKIDLVNSFAWFHFCEFHGFILHLQTCSSCNFVVSSPSRLVSDDIGY